MPRITLIVEDRGLQRRRDLGEKSRRDAGGEMAKEQGLHMLPSPVGGTHNCDASVSGGKGFGLGHTLYRRRIEALWIDERRVGGSGRDFRRPRRKFTSITAHALPGRTRRNLP